MRYPKLLVSLAFFMINSDVSAQKEALEKLNHLPLTKEISQPEFNVKVRYAFLYDSTMQSVSINSIARGVAKDELHFDQVFYELPILAICPKSIAVIEASKSTLEINIGIVPGMSKIVQYWYRYNSIAFVKKVPGISLGPWPNDEQTRASLEEWVVSFRSFLSRQSTLSSEILENCTSGDFGSYGPEFFYASSGVSLLGTSLSNDLKMFNEYYYFRNLSVPPTLILNGKSDRNFKRLKSEVKDYLKENDLNYELPIFFVLNIPKNEQPTYLLILRKERDNHQFILTLGELGLDMVWEPGKYSDAAVNTKFIFVVE